MRTATHITALAALCLIPATVALPLRGEGSVISSPESSTYPYMPSSASLVTEVQSFSISHGSGSWSPFPTSVSTSSEDFGQSPVSSSGAAPYGSLGSGPAPSVTVIVESFTVPLPHLSLSATATPKPVSTSSGVVSSKTPILSTVTATVTVPYESGSTTFVHTFTVTETGSESSTESGGITSSPLVTPLPSASLTLDSSAQSRLSRSAISASSVGSKLRSIFSDIDGSQSGVGPVIVPNSIISTRPGANNDNKGLITASFTLTVPTPTSTFFEPFMPTHTGPMTTVDFTITLPADPSSSSEGSETSSISLSSEESFTTESCTTTPTTSCELTSTPVATGYPETLTIELSTKVTITVDTTTCTTESASASAVPSGSDAITLTYTIPGGPGHESQTVTITTVRPTPQSGSQGVPSASASLPSGASSGIWPISNSTFISGPTAGPTGSGSISLPIPSASSIPTPSVIASPAISGVIVITQTKTFTEVHTATPGPNAHTSLVFGNPHHNNVTTFAAPTGTGVVTTFGTGTVGVGGGHGPFVNATGTPITNGVADPTHGVAIPRFARREAQCNRDPKNARVVLNFDDSVIEESLLSPSTEGFANPDKGMRFSGGFERVVYSSNDSFVPSSMPAMLRFKLPATTRDGAVNGVAKIGAANKCSRFHLESWKLSCDYQAMPCRFNITGFRSMGGHREVATGSQIFEVPGATKATGNPLHQITFGTEEFSNLSSFTVELEPDGSGSENGADQAWWSDDLSVARVCSGEPICTALEDIEGSKVAERDSLWHH